MTGGPPFRASFLLPQHWPTWLGLALMRAVCALPMAWGRRFGETLGTMFGKLASGRRHIVQINLKLCFPELDHAARERMVDEHFRALGAGVFEAGFAWWSSDERLARHGEVTGLEHLDAAMA